MNKINSLLTRALITGLNFKAYLLSFQDSRTHMIYAHPYDSRLTKIGRVWQQKIQSIVPDLEVYFVGSVALKIAGQRDIDLAIRCHRNNFNQYLPILIKHLGKPEHVERSLISWSKQIDNINIDICLIDPRSSFYHHLVDSCFIVRANPVLTREYEKLKLKYSGCSYRDYTFARNKFFNKVIHLYGYSLNFLGVITYIIGELPL